MATKPILYSFYRSSASWRVRIALAYKGIDYEYRPVNLLKDNGEQHSDAYQKINPLKQVPTMHIDGHILTQSLPIIEYLEETRSGLSLLPKDSGKRAKARVIAEMINSGIQPLQNVSLLKRLVQITGNKEIAAEWSREWITRGFKAVDQTLEGCAGRFCVGDDVTVADACLVPMVANALRYEIDMSTFPIILQVREELVKLDAFKAADPSQQPDYPDK